MILSFRSRPLRQFYEKGVSAKLPPDLLGKIRRILAFLDEMDDPKGMRLPHWRLHRLKGDRKDQWAVVVSGNYRITFRFVDGRVKEVDFIDYH